MQAPDPSLPESQTTGINDEQLQVLIEASSTLMSSPRLADVVPQILSIASRLQRADAYALWRHRAGGAWGVMASQGLSEAYQRVVVQQLNSARELLSRPIVVEDVENAAILSNRTAGYRQEGIRALMVLPLRIHGEPLGTIVFYFRSPRRFSESDVSVATALANIASAAIGAAELYEEQTKLRLDAEANQQRMAFLAEASAMLSSSLDYETTLRSVAKLAVPQIADWCSVSILDESGDLQLLAVEHVDPAKIEIAMEFRSKYPTDRSSDTGVWRVIHIGKPTMVEQVTDEMLVRAARDDEHLRLIRSLGMTSVMIVPIRAREVVVGAITFIGSKPERPFTADDLVLGEGLAHRAALAIDNARLYDSARREIEERERVSRERERHLAEIEELNARLTRAMTETHHRVKNGLQLISAIIDMQILDAGESIPVEQLKRLNMHVRILAAVHDVLTTTSREDKHASLLSASKVLEQLLSLVRQTIVNRKIVHSFVDLRILPRQVTSLALIANELISNSVKYSDAEIEVRLESRDEQITFGVLDRGPGFPQGFQSTQASSTGLELVENLARWDLNGSVVYGTREGGGGHVTVTFPYAVVVAATEPL